MDGLIPISVAQLVMMILSVIKKTQGVNNSEYL